MHARHAHARTALLAPAKLCFCVHSFFVCKKDLLVFKLGCATRREMILDCACNARTDTPRMQSFLCLQDPGIYQIVTETIKFKCTIVNILNLYVLFKTGQTNWGGCIFGDNIGGDTQLFGLWRIFLIYAVKYLRTFLDLASRAPSILSLCNKSSVVWAYYPWIYPRIGQLQETMIKPKYARIYLAHFIYMFD